MLQLTTKLINMFSYSITTHFILSNKDYNSYCNPYQTCPKFLKWTVLVLLLTLLVVLLT